MLRPETKKKIRNTCITIFVIIWTVVFHYESTRHFYLNPLFKKELPKIKFLFPPAGWIMFFQVSNRSGYAEVYGVKDNRLQLIDPHDIFRTRTIMFDNIHRGVLGTVLDQRMSKPFCYFLNQRFPYFDRFIVTYNSHPDITGDHYRRNQQVVYQCQGN